jgi:hypothetical protein
MEVAMPRLSRSLAIFAFAPLALLASPAWAQAPAGPTCGERASVVRNLHHGFGEMPLGYGLSSEGTVVEIYVGPSGSWTIIATNPNLVSCLIAAGEAWETASARTPVGER